MEKYEVFKSLAIIIIVAKIFGLGARKIKAPQVAGEIVAGLLIGPSVLGLVGYSDFLGQMAEIGVMLLMFTAGLETRISELKKTGIKAFLIACAGVFIPLICGALLYFGRIYRYDPYCDFRKYHGTDIKGDGEALGYSRYDDNECRDNR